MINKIDRPAWLTDDLYPFESKWIEINENTIHYIDEGNGEIILFSHAAVGWSFMFRDLIKILSVSYRCITIDYPGFGFSVAGPSYTFSIKSQADILERFVSMLRLKNIYVLGHDTGGPSAFAAFINSPEKLRGLIICDAIIFPVAEYRKISIMLGIVSTSVFNFINSRLNIVVKSFTGGGIKNRPLTQEEVNCYLNVFENKEKRRNATRILSSLKKDSAMMQRIKLWFMTTFQKKPTLLIYGENDPLTKLNIPTRIFEMLKDAELHLVKGEEHFPLEGEPDQISSVIDKWIHSIEQRREMT